MRDGSGVVDSGAMTDTFIRQRLGYLEQALAALADTRNSTARILAEQYVASYADDFNAISELTFTKIIERKLR